MPSCRHWRGDDPERRNHRDRRAHSGVARHLQPHPRSPRRHEHPHGGTIRPAAERKHSVS